MIKKRKIIHDVQKWSKESVTEEDHNINVIWFCVDGTSSKLFDDTIKSLMKATSLCKSVPIIVVITKSYSVPEREQNINMVRNIFGRQKKAGENLRDVIPVVASPYVLDENAFAAPSGIPELIERTVSLLPEGKKAAANDVNAYKLQRRRVAEESCEHYAVIDNEIVCYGRMNLLSIEDAEDNIMRVKSKNIAAELLEITFGSQTNMQEW